MIYPMKNENINQKIKEKIEKITNESIKKKLLALNLRERERERERDFVAVVREPRNQPPTAIFK